MKNSKWALTIFLLICIGCSTSNIRGLNPVYPEADSPNYPQRVDSLQPTFKWEPVKGEAVTYDFIIYDVIKDEFPFFLGNVVKSRAVGKEIYYREGLSEPKHTIEKPLRPDTEYYWTVRFRSKKEISNWTISNYKTIYPNLSIREQSNYFFIFKTPQ
jgi:hypothetical protein